MTVKETRSGLIWSLGRIDIDTGFAELVSGLATIVVSVESLLDKFEAIGGTA